MELIKEKLNVSPQINVKIRPNRKTTPGYARAYHQRKISRI